MKNRIFSSIAILCFLFSATNCFSQEISTEALLDKAASLSEKGDNAGTAEALTQGATALENEAKDSSGDLKDKILGKVGNLKSLASLASGGKLQNGILGKAVSAIKMLIGANRINKLLGKGDSGLLGNAAGLASSLGLIKAGSSILGSEQQGSLNSLLGEASKSVSEVDKKGIAGKVAATAATKQLGSIVKLVSSSL